MQFMWSSLMARPINSICTYERFASNLSSLHKPSVPRVLALTYRRLVGADGQWSRTRKMITERDAPNPIHFLRHDIYIGYFTMPQELKPGDKYDATMYVATGDRFILTRRSEPHRIQVYLQAMKTAPTERLRQAHRGGVAAEKAAIVEIFQGAGWRAEEFLKGLEESDDFYLERLGAVKLDAWSKGRVALLGDAAYCPTANTGMGTTSAIVGAYVLAGEIEKNCERFGNKDGIPVALKQFDQKLRPFMNHVQEGVVEGNIFFDLWPSSWWGVAIMTMILALIRLLRLDFFGTYFLGEDRGNRWQLPEYEGMLRKTNLK